MGLICGVKKFLMFLITTSFILIVYWAFFPEKSPIWTGFYTNIKYTKKTLWDWMDLIIIPITIIIISYLFKEYEKNKDSKIEEEKFQNQSMESFIDIISDLIIKNDLLKSNVKNDIFTLIETRIKFVLEILDGSRKGQLLQFLLNIGLIKPNSKLALNAVNFDNAMLDGIILNNIEIKGVYFRYSSINNSDLSNSNFNGCDFSNANLSNSKVENCDFSYAFFNNACLKNMNLTKVNFEGADLTNANLNNSTICQVQLDRIHNKSGIKIKKAKII